MDAKQFLSRPLARAALAQAGALGLAFLAGSLGLVPSALAGFLLQGGLAVLLSAWLGLAWWWWPLQALFLPAAGLALRAELPPIFFLAFFFLLLLIYWNTARGRVPLYLSSRAAWGALAELLPAGPFSFIDLGCGLGGLLGYLARQRVDGQFCGVESAPLPFLVSWVRLRGRNNCRVRRADLWGMDLVGYDVVYCFLSPEPMAGLWRKVQAEMRPGALFVSNSFAVPGVLPDFTVEVGGGQRLLGWRM